jgi:hypothetical protein
MVYHIDADTISLDDVRKRIEATDLVPSRACLADKIREKMKMLEGHVRLDAALRPASN